MLPKMPASWPCGLSVFETVGAIFRELKESLIRVDRFNVNTACVAKLHPINGGFTTLECKAGDLKVCFCAPVSMTPIVHKLAVIDCAAQATCEYEPEYVLPAGLTN